MKIKLQRVHFMPNNLSQGVLYVSEEFGAAAHLCACGCGSKVNTPLGPTEWNFEETKNGPTLYPSVGNWRLPCQSHYWIFQGKIEWAGKWTPEEIARGREREEQRRVLYYNTLEYRNDSKESKFLHWLKSFFR